jgi:hypothetical protein
MATHVERTTSQASLVPSSTETSLTARNGRQPSKGGLSSRATSIASSDDLRASSDVQSSGDGALDKFKSRGSDDGSSETSSQRRKMSRLFKSRKGRRKSATVDDYTSPQLDATQAVPPLPDSRPLFQSEDSLPLHKSVASSLLTEDSDAES